ncbi:MAG TPA: hypothetical protein VJP40_00965 [bacterium]|nr:hypothetical protein [bacterium]
MIRSYRRTFLTAAVLALFGAGCSGSDIPKIAVQVAPLCVVVPPGTSQQFDATIFVDSVDQGIDNAAVTWSVFGGDVNGSITGTGLYTAPNTVPPPAVQVTIIATSIEDTQKVGNATAILSGECPVVPPPTLQF